MATIIHKGRSGKKYTFKLYLIGTKFNKVGAVYYIGKRMKKPNINSYTYKDIYFGETSDLSTRFESHHKQSCFDTNNANAIGVFREGNEAKRKNIERDILQSYLPSCNEQVV